MLLHSVLAQRSLGHARLIGATIVAVLCAMPPRVALAQISDVKASKDHPMVSRYAGSIIIGYDFRKFDDFVIPLGALKRTGERPAAGGGFSPTFEPTKSERVEGRATRILYVGPQDRSPLEIVQNYELELKKNGFNTLYTCAGTQCGLDDGRLATFYLNTTWACRSAARPRSCEN
jgi:hypothetical protein